MRFISCIALLCSAFLACASPVQERSWIEVETANFRIASTLSAEETVELANNLELFRTIIQKLLNVPTVDSIIPTKIFVFKDKYDFALFMRQSNVAGFFLEGMRANYMAMRKSRELDETRVLRHEYVHFVMNNATEVLYPPWYSEGFAEFLSTVTLHDDGEHVIIGAFPMDRRSGFRAGTPETYERIISARPGSRVRTNMFYEQSWGLVHWLQMGRGDADTSAEMTRYLDLVAGGASDVDAFEEAFGISVKETDREVRKYLKSEYEAVAVPLSAFGYKRSEPRIRAMEADRISIALGQLAVISEEGETARDLYEAAIAANPTHPRAHAGLGDALVLQGKWEQAEPHYLRALELGPNDAENELDYAEFLHYKALEDEMEEQRADLLRQARRHYVRSYKLDPGIPETYAMYGYTFLAAGEEPAKGLQTLELAHALLPSDTDILWLLSTAYVRLGREEDARPLLERYVASTHAGDRTEKVGELIAELAESDDDESASED